MPNIIGYKDLSNLYIKPAAEPTRNTLNIDLEPASEPERVLNPIVSESYMRQYIEEHGGITPTGNIEITENTTEPLDIAPYATATVNVSGGATWTTVAAEQTDTTVYNSGANLYFLQLSNVTDFGSPVIKVTLDNNVYYCFWDIDNACWRDTMGTIVVAATIFNGVAYWGVAKSSDTEVTTHTAKIEADTNYSILYDITGTPTNWFITSDIGSTIPTPRNMIAQYGCTISTYMGTQVVTFDKAYAVVTHVVS